MTADLFHRRPESPEKLGGCQKRCDLTELLVGRRARCEREMADRERLAVVFRCFDTDSSGGIDLQELKAACNVLGYAAPPSKIEEMFCEADVDGSGEVCAAPPASHRPSRLR